MTQQNNKFEKAMSKKFAWNNTEHILQNPDEYSETVYLCVYYANEGWQAATQHSESILQEQQNTIAELKATIEELRYMQGVNTDFATAELQAHINALREALMDIAKTNASTHGTTQMMLAHCIKSADKALASTPAQHINDDMRIFSKDSLQAHDDEVIDRVAVLVYNYTHDEELESKIEGLKGK